MSWLHITVTFSTKSMFHIRIERFKSDTITRKIGWLEEKKNSLTSNHPIVQCAHIYDRKQCTNNKPKKKPTNFQSIC